MGLNSLVKDLCQARPESQHIANTAYAVALLKIFTRDSIQKLLEFVTGSLSAVLEDSRHRISKEELIHFRQYHFFLAWCIIQDIEIDKISKFYDKLTGFLIEHKPKSSKIHLDYLTSLQSLLSKDKELYEKIKISTEYPEYGYYIDIIIEAPHLRLAIEINGPKHYEADLKTLTALNQERQLRLESMGWKVKNFNVRLDNIEAHIKNEVLPELAVTCEKSNGLREVQSDEENPSKRRKGMTFSYFDIVADGHREEPKTDKISSTAMDETAESGEKPKEIRKRKFV